MPIASDPCGAVSLVGWDALWRPTLIKAWRLVLTRGALAPIVTAVVGADPIRGAEASRDTGAER